MTDLKTAVDNYNAAGKGVTTATLETAGDIVKITIYEPWKAGAGHTVKSFSQDDTAQALEYLTGKAADNAAAVERYS